jgi:hypothetical protein
MPAREAFSEDVSRLWFIFDEQYTHGLVNHIQMSVMVRS